MYYTSTPFSIVWFLLPFFIYIAFIAYGASQIQANFFMPSICKIGTSEKVLFLTFDDGPDTEQTPKILDLLKKYDIIATFFVIGKKIEGNEMLLLDIHKAGHTIANHSFSHSYCLDFFGTTKVTEDFKQANSVIAKIIGKKPKWFRPPYGVTNPNIARAIEKLTLTSIGWNIRSLDTVIQSKEKLQERVKKQLSPGSILLFHDTGTHSLEALEEVIEYSIKTGFKFAYLNAYIDQKAYEEI